MMKERGLLPVLLVFLVVFLISPALSIPTVTYADALSSDVTDNKCLVCHEDLYFLHDTGNLYCLREAPMSCVDCHGGDASALTQEKAHIGRAAHPVLNDDTSKCQQCHPKECDERLQIFDQNAGISDVLISMPYTPSTNIDSKPAPIAEHPEGQTTWTESRESLQILLLVGTALVAYFFHKIILRRHIR